MELIAVIDLVLTILFRTQYVGSDYHFWGKGFQGAMAFRGLKVAIWAFMGGVGTAADMEGSSCSDQTNSGSTNTAMINSATSPINSDYAINGFGFFY